MFRTLICSSSHSLFFRFFRPLSSSVYHIPRLTTLRCTSSHSSSDILSEHPPFIRIYKDGRMERLSNTETVQTSLNPQNSVLTKDIIYSHELNLSVRLFLPTKSLSSNNKIPLLIYIHGGAWLGGSPFAPMYHNYLTEVVKSANCLAVSIQYRLAPEHPIPAAYEDAWTAIKWIYNKSSECEWINKYADFSNVFLAGDSAGANMSHHMAMRAGKEKLEPRIKGVMIVHPAFWGKEPVDEHDIQDREHRDKIGELWEKLVSPNSVDGVDDPLFNVVGSGLEFDELGCEKVLVFVAGKDVFVRQGLGYARKVEKSGWEGVVEVMEVENEDHCFHLVNPSSENAPKLMMKFVEFITG